MVKQNNDKKSKKMIKNYCILAIIFVICFGFTVYLCKWYEVYDEYKKEIPVIRGTISEINYDDLDHYVVDNPSILMYVCVSNDDKCRSFEKSFKKYVNRRELNDKIIYLNLTGMDQEQFVEEFNSKYHYKTKLSTNYPAFIVFNDGEVDSILQGSDKKKLTISKLNSFLELNKFDEEGE